MSNLLRFFHQVLATGENGKITFISSVEFEVNAPSFPAEIGCPPVAEPEIEFTCSIATIGGSATPVEVEWEHPVDGNVTTQTITKERSKHFNISSS